MSRVREQQDRGGTLREALLNAGREYLTHVLATTQTMGQAAKRAGLHRTSLYPICRRYGAALPERKPKQHIVRARRHGPQRRAEGPG